LNNPVGDFLMIQQGNLILS